MAKEKPLHQQIAEAVIKAATPATRKRLELTPKGSYSILADETGWVVRLTKSVAEFNKKRVKPDALTKAGLTEAGKDDFHKKLAVVIGEPAPAQEGREPAPGAGLAELAKAVSGVKPVKS